jgi:hypothetical protein
MRSPVNLRVRHAAAAVVILLAAAHPIVYAGMFAGDAEIHLVFGRSAADGRFFEFNPGEPVAGETSPGYMLAVAGLFRALPESVVPVAMKFAGILAWYALVALTWLAARSALEPLWALVATAALALMPGAAYNATCGMENCLFAVVTTAFWALALRSRWFEAECRTSVPVHLAAGTLLGVGCWLRPEGLAVATVALGFSVALRRDVRGALVACVPVLLLAAASIACHLAYTGALLPASGLARIAMSARESIRFGPVAVSPKFAFRMCAYVPLTAAFLVGCRRVVSGDVIGHMGALRFGGALFCCFFALYTLAFGSVHLGRYTIFLMPVYVVVAALGARDIARALADRDVRATTRAAIAAACVALLATIYGVELVERARLGSHDELAWAAAAPSERVRYSDRLYEILGRPPALPISIACQEVQVRYWLDDRFVVRSLDGRVDPAMLAFVRDGTFDHVGYLTARHVSFLLGTPNYNTDPNAWSLELLSGLAPGESMTHDGLRFVRIADTVIFRIEPAN